jgi:hypothetical protein
MREFFGLAIYLWIGFAAVLQLKAAVLEANGLPTLPLGIALIKALVTAKFVLLGRMMGIGEGSAGHRAIVAVARRSFALLVLLIVLTILEEVALAMWHGRPASAAFGELGGGTLHQMFATCFVMLLILIPYVTLRVLDERLGEGRLFELMFTRPAG